MAWNSGQPGTAGRLACRPLEALVRGWLSSSATSAMEGSQRQVFRKMQSDWVGGGLRKAVARGLQVGSGGGDGESSVWNGGWRESRQDLLVGALGEGSPQRKLGFWLVQLGGLLHHCLKPGKWRQMDRDFLETLLAVGHP